MIRKMLISAATVVAMTLALLAPPASATPTATPPPGTPPVCNTVGYNNCLAYPKGGFGNANNGAAPTATPTPAPFPTATLVPVETDATATAGNEASIAFTGAESRVLGYVGAGLIGFGTIALAAARRKND